MRLESVRSLKEELFERSLTRVRGTRAMLQDGLPPVSWTPQKALIMGIEVSYGQNTEQGPKETDIYPGVQGGGGADGDRGRSPSV